MSFQVKSAWVMAVVTAVAGIFYVFVTREASAALGTTAPPAGVVAFAVFVVAASVVAQIVLALSSPKEAGAPADERDRQVLYRAGRWSGLVLATGIVLSLGHYMVFSDGNMLFHLIMGSLIVAQIAEYGLQIALDRMRF